MLFEHVYAYMIDKNYLYLTEVENEIEYYLVPSTKIMRPNLRGLRGLM